jgi:hypothetical protein
VGMPPGRGQVHCLTTSRSGADRQPTAVSGARPRTTAGVLRADVAEIDVQRADVPVEVQTDQCKPGVRAGPRQCTAATRTPMPMAIAHNVLSALAD